MRRSWVALIVVVAIIAVAVVVGTRRRPAEPPEGPTTPSTSTAAPTTEVEATKPATETPAPKPDTSTPVETPKEEPKPPKAEAVLKKAEAQLAAGKRVDAIKILSAALRGGTEPDDPAAIKGRLAKLTDDALFGPKPCPPLSITHQVVQGDRVWKLANKHKTTVELIQKLNRLKDPDSIDVGQRLKIIPGGFDVEVVKSQFRLTVTKDGLWVRELKVGLGKDGSTPVGAFVAGHKLKQPTYFGDGSPVPFEDKKNNPLGTRWITIEGAGAGQYGVHGTWEPESIGKEMSKGCVRMLNDEAEWLYDLVVPGQSKVVIKP